MATASQVKTGLDNISAVIVAQRALFQTLVNQAGTIGAALDDLATGYADVIATIQAYPANTTDAFQALSTAELTAMTTEFQALRAQVTSVTSIKL